MCCKPKNRANIIYHFIVVFFLYFFYHSSCRKDQFTVLSLKYVFTLHWRTYQTCHFRRTTNYFYLFTVSVHSCNNIVPSNSTCNVPRLRPPSNSTRHSTHSRPQSPSFLGHVARKRVTRVHKLSRVALETRMCSRLVSESLGSHTVV